MLAPWVFFNWENTVQTDGDLPPSPHCPSAPRGGHAPFWQHPAAFWRGEAAAGPLHGLRRGEGWPCALPWIVLDPPAAALCPVGAPVRHSAPTLRQRPPPTAPPPPVSIDTTLHSGEARAGGTRLNCSSQAISEQGERMNREMSTAGRLGMTGVRRVLPTWPPVSNQPYAPDAC